MEKMKDSSLFKKTLRIIVGLFILIAVVNSAFFSLSMYEKMTDEFTSKATAVAQGLAYSSVDTFVAGDPASIQSRLDSFMDINGVGYLLVVGNDHNILSHTFIGSIPEEVIKLISQHGTELTAKVSKTELEIPGRGVFIDISAPILLGKVGFLHAGMDKKFILDAIYRAIMIQNLITLGIFLVSVIIAYLITQRIISRPLTALTTYSNALADHDFRSQLAGQFGIDDLAKKSTDEISQLANSFAGLEIKLMQYIDTLEKTTAERERVKSELEVARTIQAGFLAKVLPPPFPDRKEIDLFAVSVMAKEVGGDLYDFFFIDDEHLCIVIGDVSGKGIPAALFMALTKSLLRSVAKDILDAEEILRNVNTLLYEENDACMFVTLLCGIFNTTTGELVLASGGHNWPLVRLSDNAFRYVAMPEGALIGVIEEPIITSVTVQMKPGDIILMYTDGVNEGMNEALDLFGDQRLEESTNREMVQDAKSLIMNVLQDLNSFVLDAPQADDITMLALKYCELPRIES